MNFVKLIPTDKKIPAVYLNLDLVEAFSYFESEKAIIVRQQGSALPKLQIDNWEELKKKIGY